MIAVIRSQHRQSAEKRRQFMNRHHVATATILLIIAAGTLTSCKSHNRQADNQFPDMQVSRAEAGGTARPSTGQSNYSSNESEQATEDSQAMAGSDTDGPDSEGQDMDVQDGEDWAAQTRAQTGNMAMRDAGRAGHALDNQTTDFINTINGVNVQQDDTGQRYQVPFGAEQRFHRDCVSNFRNCSQVPTNELGPPQ
jgi:hypothetical protein